MGNARMQRPTWKDSEPSMWELADGSPAYTCRECTRGKRVNGMWTCANKRCKQQKFILSFQLRRLKFCTRLAKVSQFVSQAR